MLVDYSKSIDGGISVQYRQATVVSIAGRYAYVRFGKGGASIKADIGDGISSLSKGDYVVVFFKPPNTAIITSNITKLKSVSENTQYQNVKTPGRYRGETYQLREIISSDGDSASGNRGNVHSPEFVGKGEVAIFSSSDREEAKIRGTGVTLGQLLKSDGYTVGATGDRQRFIRGVVAGETSLHPDEETDAIVDYEHPSNPKDILESARFLEARLPYGMALFAKSGQLQAVENMDLIGNAVSLRRTFDHGVFVYMNDGKRVNYYVADEHIQAGETRMNVAKGSRGLRNFLDADIYLPKVYKVVLGTTGELTELVVEHDEPDIAWAEALAKPGNVARMESRVYQSLISIMPGRIVFRFEFRERKREVTTDGASPYLLVRIRLIREPSYETEI